MNAKHAKRALGDLIGYLVLVLAVLLVIMPLAWIISTSIKPSVEIFAKPPRWIPKAPTLQNYITVLTQSDIPKAFLNSFLTGLMAWAEARVMPLRVSASAATRGCRCSC